MHLDLTYYHLAHHIVPGPQSFSYFVSLILLPIALLIPRSLLKKWQNVFLFLPIMTACTVHAWWCMNSVDVISVDVLLWALFLLALRDPWKDFRLMVPTSRQEDQAKKRRAVAEVRNGLPTASESDGAGEQTTLLQPADEPAPDDKGPAYIEQPYPKSLWRRLPWAGTLLVSIRLNDWKIHAPSHDKTQPAPPAFTTRRSFLAYSILSFLRGYLVLDLTRAYIDHDPFFTNQTIPITSPLPFAIPFLPPPLLRTMLVGAQAWALISQMFYLPCLLPVGLNALGALPDQWSPHTWPPYFGPPSAIFLHGVRGFWGQYWHQTMRWSVSGLGYALADAVGLRSGGLARYAVISGVAFGLSGAVHMGLVPPEPLQATMDVNTVRLLVAGFFWVQPVAMVIETVVARTVARLGGLAWWQSGRGRGLRMVVNCVWVIAWFSLSLSLLAEAGRQLGYWRVWPMPVSLWQGLRGEGWVAWPFLIS